MLPIKGEYAECKVFNDDVEEEAVKQIYGFLNHPAFEGLQIRIMPDVHAGAGAVIGFTSTLGDKVIPNVIGVDIGCGIRSFCIGSNVDVDFAELDSIIREHIPSGFSVRAKMPQRYIWDNSHIRKDFLSDVEKVCELTNQDFSRVSLSLGTLGGGNHFIEVGEDERMRLWLTVHTGSRNFGLKVALFHQAIAKAKNPHGDLSYLEGEDKDLYCQHMMIAEEYAYINRSLIGNLIFQAMKWPTPQAVVESVHNYIDFNDKVVRKGAIRAAKGEYVVIPWNMRDGLIIGRGKGNPDWNNSAPHGAGRVMGRNQAKKTLSLDEFKETMAGVWSSCVSAATLDEAPMVYKEAAVIEALLEPTVVIVHRVKPLYNFKASEAAQ